MKRLLAVAAAASVVLPLAAENTNGFENFVLSRNDWKSSPSRAIADFSSRTRTVESRQLVRFNSNKPTGMVLVIR